GNRTKCKSVQAKRDPEPDNVAADARWGEAVAVRGAAAPRRTAPGTATQDATFFRILGRPQRILFGQVVGAVVVLAPLPDVTVHVAQPKLILAILAHLRGPPLGRPLSVVPYG